MCPFNLPCSDKTRNERRLPPRSCHAGSPRRTGVTLNLEPLEERWLPNAAMPTPPLPPSNFVQAAVTLFNDGVDLGKGMVNQYVFGIEEIYAYPVPLAALNENIAFNSPYVGPVAPMFVLAGEIVGAQVQYQLQINSFQLF